MGSVPTTSTTTVATTTTTTVATTTTSVATTTTSVPTTSTTVPITTTTTVATTTTTVNSNECNNMCDDSQQCKDGLCLFVGMPRCDTEYGAENCQDSGGYCRSDECYLQMPVGGNCFSNEGCLSNLCEALKCQDPDGEEAEAEPENDNMLFGAVGIAAGFGVMGIVGGGTWMVRRRKTRSAL